MISIISLCRRGFEKEAAAELSETANQPAFAGFLRTANNAAFVELVIPDTASIADPSRANFFVRSTCFSRYSFVSFLKVERLPERDRITPIIAALQDLRQNSFHEIRIECPDTDEPAGLAAFSRSFARPFEKALRAAGMNIDRKSPLALHVFFPNYETCHIGLSHPDSNLPWPCGIPRLRFPSEAPSRSTLKLEEAFHTFLTQEERESWLRAGSTAVDLGASPGGWTWQFVSRGVHVTAVDNGKLAPSVLRTGLAEHVAADGFVFTPRRPVDWMVCDMVEQPSRVANLAARWIREGHCRHTIFNLKLPMKKRYEEFKHCKDIFFEAVGRENVRFAARQLYHDREEVTCFATV